MAMFNSYEWPLMILNLGCITGFICLYINDLWDNMCETLLVNYPQMSSARGRALSEQRRHPIHRAKKPWTKTKRPASNQPQNKRGGTQAIANDINSKSCRDQHSTLRAMPKFPNGSLHKNKPSMNTIHVSMNTIYGITCLTNDSYIYIWLVVLTILKNMSSSVGMMKFPIYGNI